MFQGTVVDVGLLLVCMVRRQRIVVIGMHVQSHTLDEHQGESQVGYPDDFLERGQLRSIHSAGSLSTFPT